MGGVALDRGSRLGGRLERPSPSDEAVFILPALMTVILGSLVVTKVPGNRIGLVMLVGGSFTAELRDHLDPLGVVDGWVKAVSQTMEPAALGVWVRQT